MQDFKAAAAERAVQFVEPGMRLGLGTGSTAQKFLELLALKVGEGMEVVGVPTSTATAREAERLGIPLTDLEAVHYLDLTIDGADEIDEELRLIKGGGGALLREKIVAAASEKVVIIADHSKQVAQLGAFPLPIEVEPFGMSSTRAMILAVAQDAMCTGDVTVRLSADGTPLRTDGGHVILDCAFGKIPEPELLVELLSMIPGVIDTGLFLGLADFAVIAGPDGVKVLENPDV